MGPGRRCPGALRSSDVRFSPIFRGMPTFVAMLIASAAGWLVDAPVREMFGPVPSTAASLVVGAVAFFFAKQVLTDLKGS